MKAHSLWRRAGVVLVVVVGGGVVSLMSVICLFQFVPEILTIMHRSVILPLALLCLLHAAAAHLYVIGSRGPYPNDPDFFNANGESPWYVLLRSLTTPLVNATTQASPDITSGRRCPSRSFS